MKEVADHLLSRFQKKLQELTEGLGNCRILLAVSGGVDSMVLARLFSLSGKNYGMAHCNFKLRGSDSDLDEQLVKMSAMMLGVPFYSASFDTRAYALGHKISIQEAARELRYSWLNDISFEHHYTLIATGHHLDDSIETMLINLVRGTGIAGLTGIPERRDIVIRPLLFATRKEIEAFAHAQNIEFRTDQSNLHDKYLRNRIRQHILPQLKSLNPAFHEVMAAFFDKMKAAQMVLKTEVGRQQAQCLTPEGNGFSISIQKIMALERPDFYLYEFLKDYGFSFAVCSDIYKSLEGQPGTQFFSKTHAAIKDREMIFINPLVDPGNQAEFFIDTQTRVVQTSDAVFSFDTLGVDGKPELNQGEQVAIFDFDLLHFPLLLRKIRPGDRLQPLGMKGIKKISDLLTDKKVPRHIKNSAWVLVSQSEIAWLAGYRISEKFKFTGKTKKVFIAKTGSG